MKHILIILSLICFLTKVSNGQNTYDILSVSVNRTTLQNDNTEDRYGFGLGAYHFLMADKKLNIGLGLEYNLTRQFKKYMYEGHFAHTTDLTYNINCFSVPVGLRFNIGSKTKVFLETGGFVDIVVNSNRTGIVHSYLPDENNHVHYKEAKIDERVSLSNSVGFYVGFGIRIPLSKFELIVKPDYKFGMNKLYSYQDDIFNRYFRINIGLKMNRR